MSYIILALLLAAQVASARPAVPAGWKECPNGAQYRIEQVCPIPGPHPTYIYFGRNDAVITERAEQSLQSLAASFRASGLAGGRSAFLIEAHADPAEDETSDSSLSRRRGAAISQYLVRQGMARKVIHILPAGDARPQNPTAPSVDDPDNRRALIYFVWR